MLERTKYFSISLISIGAIIISILPTPSFAQTPLKKFHMAGRVTTAAVNTIHSGKGAPVNEVGVDGDFYIDILKLNFYGPKESGHWPAPVALRGPTGVNGVDGKAGANGVDGKAGINGEKGSSTSSSGTPGPQGLQGIEGPIGLTGATGPTGANGAPGSQGLTGMTGATGISGSAGLTGPSGLAGATGSQGPIGLAGLQGSTGLTGATGPAGSSGTTGSQGAQGIQGATGATGPSQVEVTSINSWQLSTSTAGTGATSSTFGNLAASKSYEFILSLNGKLATIQAPSYALRIGLTLQCSDSSAVVTYGVSSSFGYTNDGDGTTYSKESFVIIGTLTTSASNPSSTLSVTAVDSGPTTGLDAMTLSGSAFIQLVGAFA